MGWLLSLFIRKVPWLKIARRLLKRLTVRRSPTLGRRVSRSVVAVGEEIEVELSLLPPVELGEVPDRDLVLVLDRSGSMGSGPASRLAEAVQAAEAFLARCPPQLRVGLVTFDHAAERTRAIGEAGRIRGALRGLRGNGGTAIHLALDEGRDELIANGRPGVSKTVLLLSDGGSDRASALASADALRRAVLQVEVLAAAIGAGADQELLAAVAGGETNVLSVGSSADFDRLFAFLAHRLGGATALSMAADEGARAPRPFRLLDADPTACGIVAGPPPHASRLRWALPVLTNDPVTLRYGLVAECPGWHSVANGLEAAWSMPNGTTQVTTVGEGPRVLVLPPQLIWAWPLFLLVAPWFGERFCANVGVGSDEGEAEEGPPLPSPTVPAPLPAVAARLYRPEVEPTLVIGLGRTGEVVLCRLRHRLDDRGVPDDRVLFRLVELESGERRADFGGVVVPAEERFSIACDFFPYLDGLRHDGVPATRAWVPWQEWLASPQPTTTAAKPDRRRARLALLHAAARFEEALRSPLEATVERGGSIVVVGSVDDAVASGMAGEVVHLAASLGARTTLLLAADEEPSKRDRGALERELARWLVVRGDDVPSDRTDPATLARRLLDRLVVVPSEPVPYGGTGAAAEILYALLVSRQVRGELAAVAIDADQPQLQVPRLRALVWPQEHLWRWVRERALVREVAPLLGWMPERVAAAPADAATVDRWVGAFWSAAGARYRATILDAAALEILRGTPAKSALLGRLPHEAPGHELAAFHRREGRRFNAYLDDWCRRLLAEERVSGRWGLPVLEGALLRLEEDHRRLVSAAENLLADPALGRLGRLGADLYADQGLVVGRLRREVGSCRTAWVDSRDSAVTRLVGELDRTAQALRAVVDTASLEEPADAWAARYGVALRERLAFDAHVDAETGRCSTTVRIGERILEPAEDAAVALRQELAAYRGAVGTSWWTPSFDQRWSSRRSAMRLGGASEAVFPHVEHCLDDADPGYAAVLEMTPATLASALGVVELRERELPYVWPEEANADRLRNWLRQPPIQREPGSWSPRVVHLLREPGRLQAFLGDLALGRVIRRGNQWGLLRGGRWQPIAEVIPDDSPDEALTRFESTVRQVVSLGVAIDGQLLAVGEIPEWDADPLTAVAVIEGHAVVAAATSAPGWATWRDVIGSLAVERANRAPR